tara:strand:- start:1363 stop:1665 length:303 start_codon:yes stop_codon:yes gene_type:complete
MITQEHIDKAIEISGLYEAQWYNLTLNEMDDESATQLIKCIFDVLSECPDESEWFKDLVQDEITEMDTYNPYSISDTKQVIAGITEKISDDIDQLLIGVE